MRYTLHELVRQYAAEHLAADPDEQAAAEVRHTAYYAALLQRSIDSQTRRSTPGARGDLNHNLDNLRAAWTRAAARGDTVALAAMSRVFAREAALTVAEQGSRWVCGAADAAAAAALVGALPWAAVHAAQSGLVSDMDTVADVIYHRVTS